MRMGCVKKWLPVLAAVTGVFLLSSRPAFALCATCYNPALGAKGIRALQSGILILLIPTVAIFRGLLWATFRYRNSYPNWPARAQAEPVEGEPGFDCQYQEDAASSRF